MAPSAPLLIYAFDAYCGWCYGFTPWLRRAVADRPHLAVEVVSGGLFTGSRRVPIHELRHIPTARHRVTDHTGAVFGPAFLALLLDTGSGPHILDVTHTAPTRIGEHLDSALAAIPR